MFDRWFSTAWYDYFLIWCYIGLVRLEKLRSRYPIRIDHRAYLLHPEIPLEGRDWNPRPGDHRSATWQRVEAMAKFEGIIMRRVLGTVTPYTRLAQPARHSETVCREISAETR
jgi:predicted DsbA family dithiol-disulfide isomerase